MEFLDTPNPNAKKILVDHDFETSIYLNEDISTTSLEVSILLKISGIWTSTKEYGVTFRFFFIRQ